MTKLVYFPRPKRSAGDGPWWLEVAVIGSRNDNPRNRGQVLAMFELTADALEYAVGLATVSRSAVQLLFDDNHELGAIMAAVEGQTITASVYGGQLEIELGQPVGRAVSVVVRPCHAPGEPPR